MNDYTKAIQELRARRAAVSKNYETLLKKSLDEVLVIDKVLNMLNVFEGQIQAAAVPEVPVPEKPLMINVSPKPSPKPRKKKFPNHVEMQRRRARTFDALARAKTALSVEQLTRLVFGRNTDRANHSVRAILNSYDQKKFIFGTTKSGKRHGLKEVKTYMLKASEKKGYPQGASAGPADTRTS